MKDMIKCDEDVAYKDVVIIGNGPSGIVLSFILSGNWPYYNGGSHPDEMLLARLQSVPNSVSLLEQDLQFLSQGLEGRSRNPVAVLVDSLIHPSNGQISNDSSLLSWKRHPEKLIDHVVIGKGKPGGCWQNLDGNLTTVSVSSWMELPGLSFNEWENIANNASIKCPCKDTNRLPPKRVKIKQVAKYYRDYVEHMRLSKNFRNFSGVTSVKPVTSIDSYDFLLPSDMSRNSHFWEVKGFDMIRKKYFCYVCRNVVLANGTYDDRNLLNIPEELSHPDWILHDLKQFRNAVVDLKKCHSADVDPVVIVGSGLTAADAVLTCSQFGLPVLHVFNTFAELNDTKLPKNMYPDYDLVYRMMKSCELERHYTPLFQYTVSAISKSAKGKRVVLKSPKGQDKECTVSLVAIMIGCLPDLSFLSAEFDEGKKLGVEENKRIQCRSNPIRISPWSYEVTNSSPGLYAMGPLVGDNVIRVIPGGAVAIASHLFKDGIQ